MILPTRYTIETESDGETIKAIRKDPEGQWIFDPTHSIKPGGIPPVLPRRPYDDDDPDGYLESDDDFMANNIEACLWFLAHAKEIIHVRN